MRFRQTVGLVLMFSMSACWRYSEVGALPDPVELPPQTRVHIYDGEVVSLTTARLAADTIRGIERETRRERVIPLAAVDLIEAKRFQVVDSVIFATLAVLVFVFIVRGLGRRPNVVPGLPSSAGVLAPTVP